jgi:hypothetical protein
MINDDLADCYREWFILDARAKAGDPPSLREVTDMLAAIRAIEKLVDDPDAVYFATKAHWKMTRGVSP